MDLENNEDMIIPMDIAAAINKVSTPLVAAWEKLFSIKYNIV